MIKAKQEKESIQADNEIIGYAEGYAVIENEWGNLFVCEMPEEFVEIGEVIESQYLLPLSDLPCETQELIKKAVK